MKASETPPVAVNRIRSSTTPRGPLKKIMVQNSKAKSVVLPTKLPTLTPKRKRDQTTSTVHNRSALLDTVQDDDGMSDPLLSDSENKENEGLVFIFKSVTLLMLRLFFYCTKVVSVQIQHCKR